MTGEIRADLFDDNPPLARKFSDQIASYPAAAKSFVQSVGVNRSIACLAAVERSRGGAHQRLEL